MPYLALYVVASVAAFAAMAWDKRRAARGGRRVAESTLHVLEAFGGFPGSIAAMRALRHKNRKARFFVVTYVIGAVHAAAWLAVMASR